MARGPHPVHPEYLTDAHSDHEAKIKRKVCGAFILKVILCAQVEKTNKHIF